MHTPVQILPRNVEPRRGSGENFVASPRKRIRRIRGLQDEKPYGLEQIKKKDSRSLGGPGFVRADFSTLAHGRGEARPSQNGHTIYQTALNGAQAQCISFPGVRHLAALEGETFYLIQPRRGSRFVAPGWPAGPTGGIPQTMARNPVGVPLSTRIVPPVAPF